METHSIFSLNKKGKVTNGIKQFIEDTNKHFDINQINVFRKELPNLYTVQNTVPRGTGEKLFNPSYFVMYSDYRDTLSFKKYECVNHYFEFCTSEHGYDWLMVLALILNGYPYKFEVFQRLASQYTCKDRDYRCLAKWC
jgi:hypothetical protein